MKLIDLEPYFVRHAPQLEEVTLVDSEGVSRIETREVHHRVPVATLAQAQGIYFLCPKCWKPPDGVGTHSVLCWFEDRGVPDDVEPGPGRWKPEGTGVHDLSFVPGKRSNSVQLRGGCNWHGFVKDGNVSVIP